MGAKLLRRQPEHDNEDDAKEGYGELMVTISLGMFGLMTSISEAWCFEERVSHIVGLSRLLGIGTFATLSLIPLLIYFAKHTGTDDYAVLSATIAFAVASSAPAIGVIASEIFNWGNKGYQIAECAIFVNGNLGSRTYYPNQRRNPNYTDNFFIQWMEAVGVVLCRNTLFRELLPKMETFWKDINYTYRTLKEDFPSMFRAFGTFLLFCLAFSYFVAHLLAAAVELILTFFGAPIVCFKFVNDLKNRRDRHYFDKFSMLDCLTCEDCRDRPIRTHACPKSLKKLRENGANL